MKKRVELFKLFEQIKSESEEKKEETISCFMSVKVKTLKSYMSTRESSCEEAGEKEGEGMPSFVDKESSAYQRLLSKIQNGLKETHQSIA